MDISKQHFGNMPDGREISEFTITNKNGMLVSVISLGATVRRIVVPVKDGDPRDVVLGFDTVDDYLHKSDYQGATVGRFANRIAGGSLRIDGVSYELVKNEKDRNCLHSGGELSFTIWDAIMPDSDCVEFTHTSPDGCNGFPGTVRFTVSMKLTEDNRFIISYTAVSDKKTPINLTNHSYFNLNGFSGGDVLSHTVTINASKYTPVDEYSIPTGDIAAVAGTVMDFRQPKTIGQDLDSGYEQLVLTGGYDHNYCIDKTKEGMSEAAQAVSADGEVTMKVSTTLPGLQFYSGNYLSGAAGKDGVPMNKHGGFCFETQYYPDSPNRLSFPNCIFGSRQEYSSRTVFQFITKI